MTPASAPIAELEAAIAASKAECGILDALLNDNDEALNAALRDDIVGMQRERIERLTALRQDAIAKESEQ